MPPDQERLYLSTVSEFAVDGLSGAGADLFACVPFILGETAACAFLMFWGGSESGLTNNSVDAFTLAEPERLWALPGNQTLVPEACDGIAGAVADDPDDFLDESLFLPVVMR